MMADFVEAQGQDQEEIYRMIHAVFHYPEEVIKGHQKASLDPYYEPRHRRVARVDGKIVSHLQMTHRTMRVGVAEVGLCGILWVATLPEYRGRGYAQRLLGNSLDYMRQAGLVVSTLSSPIPNYYRELGWDQCFDSFQTKMDVLKLPTRAASGFTVFNFKKSHLPQIMRLYVETFGSQTGTICREMKYWEWVLEQGKLGNILLAANEDGRIVAYLCRLGGRIVEAASRHGQSQSYRSLLHSLRRQLIKDGISQLTTSLPTDHALCRTMRHYNGRSQIVENTGTAANMAKITDLYLYLSAVTPELERRLHHSPFALVDTSLSVSFSAARKNSVSIDKQDLSGSEIRWSGTESMTVVMNGGKVSVQPGVSASYSISGGENDIVRVLLGYRSATDAHDLGRLTASSKQALALADAIFPRGIIWRSEVDSATS